MLLLVASTRWQTQPTEVVAKVAGNPTVGVTQGGAAVEIGNPLLLAAETTTEGASDKINRNRRMISSSAAILSAKYASNIIQGARLCWWCYEDGEPEEKATHAATYGVDTNWYLDSGASSHVTDNPGNLDLSNYPLKSRFTSIVVGNGTHLPIQATGSVTLPPHNFHLRDILFSPHVVTSLISVRQFTKDNLCSIEFFPYGFVVKDLRTRRVIMISASSDDLYPFFGNNKSRSATLSATTSTADVWHRRLGHPSPQVTSSLAAHDFLPSCNKLAHIPCSACQLGRQPRLSFSSSLSRTYAPFELVHCDLWMSPVLSFSWFQ